MKNELNERILSDDYPVYFGYLYVCDGKIIKSDRDGNVGDLKSYHNAKEVTNCDIFGRQDKGEI